jgi:hypothetical protein
MNTQLIEFPARGCTTAVQMCQSGAGKLSLGSDTRPRNKLNADERWHWFERNVTPYLNYGDELRREAPALETGLRRGGFTARVNLPRESDAASPTSSAIDDAFLNGAASGFFAGCFVMTAAFVLGVLFWRAM